MSTLEAYTLLHQKSLENIHQFWLDQARILSWETFPTQSLEYVWDGGANTVEHKWFVDGTLNVSVNCLDRHLQNECATKLALIWQSQNSDIVRKMTYQQLHRMVCRFANVLQKKRIKPGERVVIYLPLTPEAIVCMLACARIGAVSVLVLANETTLTLKNILQNSQATLLIMQDEYQQANEVVQNKANMDIMLQDCPNIKYVTILKQGEGKCTLYRPRDSWWHHEMEETSLQHQAVALPSLDPLFISYQNNTAEPLQGLVYASGGFVINACVMHPYLFTANENNTFGSSETIADDMALAQLIYGTLCHGATLFLQENFMFSNEANLDFSVKFNDNNDVKYYPCLGMDPVLLNEAGEACKNNEIEKLFLKRPWPGIAQTIWGDHNGFIKKFFSSHPLYYNTGW